MSVAAQNVRRVSIKAPFVEQLWGLARPANFSLPLLQILVGYVLAGGSLFVTDIQLYLLALTAFITHSAVTIDNDLADRRVDIANNVDTVITNGTSSQLRMVCRSVAVLYGAAFVGAVLLLPVVGGIILVMIIGGLLYNHPPFVLSRRPIGSIVTLGILYGAAPIAAGYALSAGVHFPAEMIVIFVAWAFGRVGLSFLKDFKDEAGDLANGKRTFLIAFGHRTTLLLSTFFSVVGLSVVAVIVSRYVMPAHQLLFFGSSAAILGVIISLRAKLHQARGTANQLFQQLLYWQLIFDGAILLWLII